MTPTARLAAAALAALPVLVACGTATSGTDGDCTARVRYQQVVYRPDNASRTAAPLGTALGTGDVVGCGDGASAPKVDEVTLFAVRGVPPSIAVQARRGQWDGIYVAEDVPRSEWPKALRRP